MLQELADENQVFCTHASRKTGPNEAASSLSARPEAIKQTGQWNPSLYNEVYNQLGRADDVAINAGFLQRKDYYIPRGDLMPSSFETLEFAGRSQSLSLSPPQSLSPSLPHSLTHSFSPLPGVPESAEVAGFSEMERKWPLSEAASIYDEIHEVKP